MVQANAVFGHGKFIWMCQWCFLTLISMEWPVCPMWTWPHLQGMLYTPGVLSPRSSFTGQSKLVIFLSGRPTDLLLCLDSIQLMCLKVMLTKGRRATEVGNSLQWIESPSDLPVTITILPESVPEELQLIMRAFMITQTLALCTNMESTACWKGGGSSHGDTGWCVCVRAFMRTLVVDSVTQWSIMLAVYINVKKG
jgi:hypothetical protein